MVTIKINRPTILVGPINFNCYHSGNVVDLVNSQFYICYRPIVIEPAARVDQASFDHVKVGQMPVLALQNL